MAVHRFSWHGALLIPGREGLQKNALPRALETNFEVRFMFWLEQMVLNLHTQLLVANFAFAPKLASNTPTWRAQDTLTVKRELLGEIEVRPSNPMSRKHAVQLRWHGRRLASRDLGRISRRQCPTSICITGTFRNFTKHLRRNPPEPCPEPNAEAATRASLG